MIQRTGNSSNPVVSSLTGTSGTQVWNMTIDGGGSATYGILLYQTQYVTLDNLSIDNVHAIPLGVVQTYHVYFFNSYIGQNLSPSVDVSPHVYITNSDQVWIGYGEFVGKQRTTTHDGDGGFAMYGSSHVRIYGNYVLRGGTYFASSYGVPTSYVDVWGNTYEHSNEWPMDVVEGAHHILISDNEIRYAFHGAMVLWNTMQVEASYNLMENNNQGGYAACQAINNRNSTQLNIHDNSALPGPVMCTFN